MTTTHPEKLDDCPSSLGERHNLCHFSDPAGQRILFLRSVTATYQCSRGLSRRSAYDSDLALSLSGAHYPFPLVPETLGRTSNASQPAFYRLADVDPPHMIHLTLVVVVHFPEDVSDMVLGATNPNVTLALRIVSIWLIGIALFPIWATIYTLRHQRQLQIQATAIVEPVIRFLFGGLRSRQHFTKADISPYFRGNDYRSEIESSQRLARKNFAPWELTLGGLLEHPLTLSLDDLRAFPKPGNTIKHNCIQVWSTVGQWRGVRMSTILDKCRPLPQARYIVFNAFPQAEYAPDVYDEVLTLEEITTSPTMLAYELNWNSLPVPHVAPYSLRIAIKTGYRMVRYHCAIVVVDSVDKIGKGFGGYREDHQYNDRIAAI